jgi:hypothetical protein
MTRNQYEQHKRRLEEQLRAGIQLLETACQAQVRALELVWMLQVEAGEQETFFAPEPAPSPSPPKEETPPPPVRPRRRGVGELEGDLRAALPHLPETFTRRDIGKELGYEPDRGSLYRILQDLVREGSLRVESVGTGQIPTVYRQIVAPDAPAPG